GDGRRDHADRTDHRRVRGGLRRRGDGGLTMPFLDAADGTRLFYKDLGGGSPVVAVHSWSLSSSMWEYQLPTLVQRGHRFVALDRRGHGRSDVAGTGYDLDTLADDLHGLLEVLDLRDVTFLAHSMGTCEVTRYLTRHGDERVARAVFVGAMTPHFAGAVTEAMVDAVIADLHTDQPAWFRNGVDAYFARPASGVSQPLADDGVATILATPLEVQAACMRAFARTDLTAELQAIEIPVLVIHGDVDASAPLEITGRPTAQLISDARLEVYAGAPHGLYVTHRERLAEDLGAFIP
ncbi:MAG: alpha/beta fold hydrolase, partial [Ilumatobacteraceae bacterium]